MVVAKVEQGVSCRQVAREMGIRPNTVSDIMKKHRETKSVADLPRSGRPRKTTPRDDRLLLRMSLGDRRLTASNLQHILAEEHNINLAVRTVRKRLQKAGLRGCVAVKKPLLTAAHRKARVTFAAEHKDWTVERWKSVLFSDESSFQVFCGAKRAFVRRKPKEKYNPACIIPIVKHGGGSIMVWGCMSWRAG